MSWWIYLNDNEGKPVSVPQFTDGGTYCMGGEDIASLNITYNYGNIFDFWQLDKKKASETLPLMAQKAVELGFTRDADYWAATPGNVGWALARLVQWAALYPDATWDVS